jgi:hypothetical protein
MSSPSSNENLSAYFDRESSDEESRELESLLEESAAVRQELHEFGEISRLIQETATESAPPELAPSIRKRIEQETLLNSTAATPATAPAPSGPSMLRYRIAVAISTCSSLAALVLFVLLLNIPEPNAGTNWQMTSTDQQATLLSQAEPAPESVVALREGEQIDAYHHTLSYQGKPVTDLKMKTAAAPPENAPSVSLRMSAPAAAKSELVKGQPGVGGADLARKETADFAIKNTIAEQKAMQRMAEVQAQNRLTFPTIPPMTGLPSHIPMDAIRIGDVLPYFQDINGKVAVIEVRVVDVKQALGTMELLLSKNNIPVNQKKQSEVERQLNRLNSQNGNSAGEKKTEPAQEDELFAVFVEASDTQVASALNDLQKDLNQSQLLGLSLQPAIDESSLTESVKDLPRLLADNTAAEADTPFQAGGNQKQDSKTSDDASANDGLARSNENTGYQTRYRMQVPAEQLTRRAREYKRATPLPTLSQARSASPEAPLVASKPNQGLLPYAADQKLTTSQRSAGGDKPPVRVLFVFKNSQSQTPVVPPAPPASR